jgi:proline iminopeptidase
MTDTPDSAAFPRPLDAIMLSVGDGHWLYVEEVGTRGGVPAIFLHGGPGSGAQHRQRALFDAGRFHAILFDQRGAGRSHPYLSTTANTTQHLIADIEAIRCHFGFEKWIVAGGSWGSTLALAYTQAHPDRVAGLVLRAVFLGTREEVEWAFKDGPQRFRPELYEAFAGYLPEAERADPVAAYIRRITSADPAVRNPAAQMWAAYERVLSELTPAVSALPQTPSPEGRVPPTAIMEAHYISSGFFLAPDEIITNAHRLAGIPGVIVQGRYDLLCPPRAAHSLARAWPDCRLTVIDNAGHAMTEPGVEDAMRRALNAMAESY